MAHQGRSVDRVTSSRRREVRSWSCCRREESPRRVVDRVERHSSTPYKSFRNSLTGLWTWLARGLWRARDFYLCVTFSAYFLTFSRSVCYICCRSFSRPFSSVHSLDYGAQISTIKSKKSHVSTVISFSSYTWHKISQKQHRVAGKNLKNHTPTGYISYGVRNKSVQQQWWFLTYRNTFITPYLRNLMYTVKEQRKLSVGLKNACIVTLKVLQGVSFLMSIGARSRFTMPLLYERLDRAKR